MLCSSSWLFIFSKFIFFLIAVKKHVVIDKDYEFVPIADLHTKNLLLYMSVTLHPGCVLHQSIASAPWGGLRSTPSDTIWMLREVSKCVTLEHILLYIRENHVFLSLFSLMKFNPISPVESLAGWPCHCQKCTEQTLIKSQLLYMHNKQGFFPFFSFIAAFQIRFTTLVDLGIFEFLPNITYVRFKKNYEKLKKVF